MASGIWESMGNALTAIGRVFGLNPSEDGVEEYVDDYDPMEAYAPEEAEEPEPAYADSYGAGGSYVRAGVKPTRPKPRQKAAPHEPKPAGGMFTSPRRPEPMPDNVVPMPRRERGEEEPLRRTSAAHTVIFSVRRKDDAEEIINNLLEGVNVILNLEGMEDTQVQRVIDMVSGAAYALRGSVERISHRNYLVAPSGASVVRSQADDDDGRYAAR